MAYEVDIERVPYAKTDDGTLEILLYRPRGRGPFPAMLDLHGGAWTYFEPEVDFYWCRALARRGFVMASVGFRTAPAHPWPIFLEDVRAASRWLRAHAATLGIDPRAIGAVGGSTGGQLAAMLALRPRSLPGRATPALDVHDRADAHVDFAVPLWPILDVPGRYAMVREARFDAVTEALARRLLARGEGKERDPRNPGTTARLRRLDALRTQRPRVGNAVGRATLGAGALMGRTPLGRALLFPMLARAHEGAFADAKEMEEASPLHVLRRGDAERTPPLLIVHGLRDTNMTREMTDAFVAEYRARGGEVTLKYPAQLGHSFGNVPSAAADRLVDAIEAFARAAASRPPQPFSSSRSTAVA